MKQLLKIFAFAVLTGCSTVSGYFPDSKVVTIDGIEYMARPLSAKNSWQAGLNRPTGSSLLLINPTIYAGNVEAIEKASGCAVLLESVQNSDNSTIAAVDCGKSKTAKQ